MHPAHSQMTSLTCETTLRESSVSSGLTGTIASQNLNTAVRMNQRQDSETYRNIQNCSL